MNIRAPGDTSRLYRWENAGLATTAKLTAAERTDRARAGFSALDKAVAA